MAVDDRLRQSVTGIGSEASPGNATAGNGKERILGFRCDD